MMDKKPIVYAVKHRDESIRAASRSGGIFTALSDLFLDEGGVVYGCVLTEDFRAVHMRTEDKDSRNSMRGSKYIQSDIGNIFRNVKEDIENGKNVLFSGTSCQVTGLKSFLGQGYDNLLCIDIVCHGVPSPMIWKAYLTWQEKKHSGKVIAVDFRNKKDYGWHEHVETLLLNNGKKIDSRVFTRLFYGHNILRPCCYKCPYKDIMHPGDITIADYWGIENAAPGFDDNKGVSLVLINNAQGEKIFERINDSLEYRATKIEDSLQPPLISPFDEPKERAKFWEDFQNRDFNYIAKRYGGAGFINKIIRKLRAIKQRVVKKVRNCLRLNK